MRRSLLVLTKLPQRQRGDNSRENHLALQSGKVVKQKKKKKTERCVPASAAERRAFAGK
jgi:hypothetical protein